MKKLMLLLLASGFVSLPAHAKKDETPPKCDQVIQAINTALQKNRASSSEPANPAPVSEPGSAPAR